MLTLTNRGGIRNSIVQWSQRKNIPETVLNDFIEIALTRATRSLRIPPLESYQELPIDTGGYAELPFNFMEAKEVSVIVNDKAVILERKAIHEVDWASNSSPQMTPCYFGRFGNYFRVAPWTGETGTLKLYYYTIIPAMPDDNTENWFTLYAPEVLLYGGLAELASYTRDAEGAQNWNGKFNEAINIIQAVEERAAWNGSTLAISLQGSTR